MEDNIIDFFKENLSTWYDEAGYSPDCRTYLHHEKKSNRDIPEYRQKFGININEIILFTRDTSPWNSHDEGIVITDIAIYYKPYDALDSRRYLWTVIDKVEYKEYSFYFYSANNEILETIGQKYFFKAIDKAKLEGHVGKSLASDLTIMAIMAGKEIGTYDEVLKLEDTRKYDEAIALLDRLMKDDTVKHDSLSHFYRGRVLLKKEMSINNKCSWRKFDIIEKEFLKAEELSIKATEEAFNAAEVSGDYLSLNLDKLDFHACNYWRAYNFREHGNNCMARNLFMDAMCAESEEIRENAKEMFYELEDTGLWNKYTSDIDYKDRKFLMPINDSQIAGCWIEGIDTFRMSNIPSCIKFPVGHPIAGELYIGHPYNSSVYVPYEGSEDVFFVDKIHELCYLLQCLGAEEISITSIKGKSIDELNNADATVGGNANIKAASLSGEYGHSASVERNTSSNIQRTISQKFDPMQKPYVPEGLIWFPEQTKWQRLVDSRLNGNLLEYSEFVSTSDTKFVSSSERTTIKASAEYLWAKIDGNAELKSESQFKESVETQWKVEVKFRSIKQFVEESAESTNASNLSKGSAKLTTNEQEYIDSLKDFLEDDAEITPHERKMLDRIRQKLGISEERAAELETSLKPQLTEDEQEYLEMYHEYEAKGEITEKERRRLEKFAGALNIPSNRIIELENL